MNSRNNQAKDIIRKKIAGMKRRYTQEDLRRMSEEVFSVFEITGIFNEASKIGIYNAMKDEVSTQSFIDRWIGIKEFYMPVVKGDDIVLRKLEKDTTFEKSAIGVLEPVGKDFAGYSELDLILIPGIAFDRKCNRLGRGKGYYDRFLSGLNLHKVGVCFDFQLFDNLPADNWDVKMDMIVSENDLIW